MLLSDFSVTAIPAGVTGSRCGFDLHFPNDRDAGLLRVCSLASRLSSLEKCVFKSFAHLNRVVCLFIVELEEIFFGICQKQAPYQIYDLQIFPPILGVVIFTFLMDGVL